MVFNHSAYIKKSSPTAFAIKNAASASFRLSGINCSVSSFLCSMGITLTNRTYNLGHYHIKNPNYKCQQHNSTSHMNFCRKFLISEQIDRITQHNEICLFSTKRITFYHKEQTSFSKRSLKQTFSRNDYGIDIFTIIQLLYLENSDTIDQNCDLRHGFSLYYL